MDDSAVMKRMLEAAMKAHPESFAGFDTTKNVQDQLQEMVLRDFVQQEGGYLPTYWLLHKFNHWLPNYRYVCTSMEQLWLAFVMKGNGKVWDGDKWEVTE